MKIFAQNLPPIQALYGIPSDPVPPIQNSFLTILLIAVTPLALIIGLVVYLKKKKKNVK